ncbi:hypothetical protein AB0I28_30275 [Phytomonospora sp. NPDC050363]|uniref:hypothetical protein n=1 Tax=Phytomonospora sp. NPDC050363 TaxID=3155642 RepID=UPI0033DBCD4E
MQLTRKARRAAVVVHSAASAAWLGLTVGLLALGVRAYTSGSPDIVTFSYRAMDVFGEYVLIPAALATLISGVVLSLGTPWGLLRHKWVAVKFVLTMITVGLVAFSMSPGLSEKAALAAAGTPVVDVNLIVAPTVALSTYVFMLALSILKPWGMTPHGRRVKAAKAAKAAEERRAARVA